MIRRNFDQTTRQRQAENSDSVETRIQALLDIAILIFDMKKLLLLAAMIAICQGRDCNPETWFKCNNGVCISKTWVCIFVKLIFDNAQRNCLSGL